MRLAHYAVLAFATLLPLTGQGQTTLPSKDDQIAAAILPLPKDQRATARVLGYESPDKLTIIRPGSGMVCLSSNPRSTTFHVACYHEAMEPFMARGRELRSQGVKDPEVDSVRFREVRSGKLKMPAGATVLYSLTGGSFDAQANAAPGARHLYVVYIPFATGASTGLSERPVGMQPWIMFPGTPKAHIMFTPGM
jgi:hypothetical protein